MEIFIEVSEMEVSNASDHILIASHLGACIGLTAYDPVIPVGGVLHIMLPSSKDMDNYADSDPFMFADTGIPLFFDAIGKAGASKERLKVVVAGGAKIMLQDLAFNVGRYNRIAVRKHLEAVGVDAAYEDCGGHCNRNLRLNMDTGQTTVATIGQGVITV